MPLAPLLLWTMAADALPAADSGTAPVLQSVPPPFAPPLPAPPLPAPPLVEGADAPPPVGSDGDDALLPGRKRPGVLQRELPPAVTQDNPGAVRAPPPEAFPTDQIPVPDRWRLAESLGVVHTTWLDPYHQNTLKGDRPIDRARVPWLPIRGDDWFFAASAISDTVVEPRSFPTPVGVQTTARPGSLDVFGKGDSLVLSQTIITGISLIKGSTAFKPPEIEYRLTLATNINYVDVSERRVLDVRPTAPTHRTDSFIGVQEAFIDRHLRNVSDRYDFDSVRIGIQPFQADFRGFLFNDNQLGLRFFGNRDDNRFQYNLAAFWRLEKDTNSGLNDVTATPRHDYVFDANLYRQDFPVPGLTSQVTVVWNANREKHHIYIDDNGFPERPALIGTLRGRNYDVVYLGYSVDGKIGRLNLDATGYVALGKDRASYMTGRDADMRAFFLAAEPSMDFDWVRLRLSGLYASGDHHPYDGKETGFDAIFENPIFAGADTSYWIRQSIPFAGGGRVISLDGRNGILNSLRSSKDDGQSNFNNPGTILLGAGADLDLLPQLRVSTNLNHLWFENTSALEVDRSEGGIPRDIGWDLSAATIWRPKMTQNIVFRLSGAILAPGRGFKDLFDNSRRDKVYYSVLFNMILSF